MAILPLGIAASDWSQFRGPLGNGASRDARLPDEWSETTNLAWKIEIPGAGWSQPIIANGTVFLTAATSTPPLRPKSYAAGVDDPHTTTGSKTPAPDIALDWKLWAMDESSGRIRWERTLATGKPRYPAHPSNTYASETPAADAARVCVFFGSAGVAAAFDYAGALHWKRDLGVFRMRENYGTGSSPRLHSGLLYIQCFNEDQAFVVCLDAANGREKWRLSRPRPGSCWNTPLFWHTASGPDLVVYSQKLMTGLDPVSGVERWRMEGLDMPAMTSACADEARLYFGCRDPYKGGPLRALSRSLRGIHDTPNAAPVTVREAWSAPGSAPGMPSPVASDGFVFAVHDTFLACHAADTGRQVYKERLPGLGAVIASPIVADGKLLVLGESGAALVLRVGPRFEILGRSKLDDLFWASPAVTPESLLLRGAQHLYCVRSLPGDSPPLR